MKYCHKLNDEALEKTYDQHCLNTAFHRLIFSLKIAFRLSFNLSFLCNILKMLSMLEARVPIKGRELNKPVPTSINKGGSFRTIWSRCLTFGALECPQEVSCAKAGLCEHPPKPAHLCTTTRAVQPPGQEKDH